MTTRHAFSRHDQAREDTLTLLAATESPTRRSIHASHEPGREEAQPRPKRRIRARLGLAAIVVACVAYQGSLRQPMGPAAGAWLHAPRSSSPREGDTLRIGTFNMHGAKGTDGVRNLERIAETVRGLDFVGLNEVHGALPFQDEDQAAALGQSLGLAWLYAPTEQRWWCDQFGNGLLSNLAVSSWQRIPLAREHGKSFRNAVLVRAEHCGRPVNLLVTHIDRSDDRERAEQLRTVGEMFLALAAPAILMGDMNTDATEPALRKLLETPGVQDPLRDRLGDAAPRRIDWILVRGLDTVDAGMVTNGASDHPHVWAELAWPQE